MQAVHLGHRLRSLPSSILATANPVRQKVQVTSENWPVSGSHIELHDLTPHQTLLNTFGSNNREGILTLTSAVITEPLVTN